MDWNELLVEDMVLLVLKQLDPLTLLLYGMSSKASRRHRTRVFENISLATIKYSVWVFLDRHGTVPLLEWAETQWDERERQYKNTSNALRTRNFAVAEWLLEKKDYNRYGFDAFIDTRDYEGMTWCHDHGFKVYPSQLSMVHNDPVCMAWMAERNVAAGLRVFWNTLDTFDDISESYRKQYMNY